MDLYDVDERVFLSESLQPTTCQSLSLSIPDRLY